MNKIDARVVSDKFTNNYLSIHIDNNPLDVLLSDLMKEERYKGLVPAWSSFLESKNEQDYIWEIVDEENAEGISLPILLCPDDLDFSCTVIVAKIFNVQDTVIWNKIGIIKKDNWNISEWRKSGIRNTDKWSAKDWERYVDYFDLFDSRDEQWENWISENWLDEERRRIHNYVHQYFNIEENIEWFHNIPKLIFDREEYLKCIDKFRKELY